MVFDILTIFPEMFDSFLKESLLKKAQDKKLVSFRVHNLRNWTDDPHKTTDDSPYGGGLGMVMKVEPIFKAVTALQKLQITNYKAQTKHKTQRRKKKTILFTPRGEKFTQKMAYEFSKLDQLIMICGRYEGVDERVARRIADKEVSVGDFVLMGGELPAMLVAETVSRLVPGVVGKPEFLKERSRKKDGFLEYPQYTRPAEFSPKKGVTWKAPQVLLSGDHKKIEEWRQKRGKIIGKEGNL